MSIEMAKQAKGIEWNVEDQRKVVSVTDMQLKPAAISALTSMAVILCRKLADSMPFKTKVSLLLHRHFPF